MHDGTPSIHGRWRTADPTLDPATAPTPTKTPGDSAVPGDNIGVYAVHMALLHTGNVLMFSGGWESSDLLHRSWSWDPTQAPSTAVGRWFMPEFDDTTPPHMGVPTTSDDPDIDLFCCHTVFLPDGRLLAVGGDGAGTHDNVSLHIYDPVLERWSKIAGRAAPALPGVVYPTGMIAGRWYPTAVVLADGSVAVFSGDSPGPLVIDAEILRPPDYLPVVITGGRRVTGGSEQPLFMYPGMHLVRGGRVFYIPTSFRYSSSETTNNSQIGPTASFQMTGPTAAAWQDYFDAADPTLPIVPANRYREEGTSVLLSPAQAGRIMLIGGGWWDGSNQHGDHTSCEILDTQAATPTWSSAGQMHHARVNVNAILLPDGKVLIIGGHDRYKWNPHTWDSVAQEHAQEEAEIYDPTVAFDPLDPSAAFTPVASMHAPRTYHSTAVLLPDGSVLVGGGSDPHEPLLTTPRPTDEKHMEIYEPPYFHQGQRPLIDAISGTGGPPDQIHYGGEFTIQYQVESGVTIDSVSLMRPCASTHHTNTEQRHVPLTFAPSGANTLEVQVINDATVAPPGYYMVFIVDSNGRPCERAQFVRLSNAHCTVVADRSHFSHDEVEAAAVGGVSEISPAFYLLIDGYTPTQLGITTTTPTPAQVEAFAPTFSFTDSAGPVPNIEAFPTAMLLEVGGASLGTPQRVTFEYGIRFTGTAMFPAIGATPEFRDVQMAVNVAGHGCTNDITLFRQPNPYMLDGPTSWLSADLRVFALRPGEAQSGRTLSTASPDPLAYLAGFLTACDAAAPSPMHLFDQIATDQHDSRLYLGEDLEGDPVFNFAIARVRYRSLGTTASDVRVFFRSFTTAVTSMAYATQTYPRNASETLPVLGASATDVLTIPYFGTSRATVDTTGDTVNTKPIPPDAGGDEVHRYFGVWLDFNQITPRYTDPDDGVLKSIQDLIRGRHQCLVAEIRFGPDSIPLGDTPANNDNLAQRNLAIVESDNPGPTDSHLVVHTFDLRTTWPQKGPRTPRFEERGHLFATNHGVRGHGHTAQQDELMIQWNGLPEDSEVTLYLPSLNADEILAAAARRPGPARLEKVDTHTIRCLVGDVSYIPLPAPAPMHVAGLITIRLPETVKVGERYNIIVRQLGGLPRYVVGTFELFIAVSTSEKIRPEEERTLSVLKHIAGTIKPSSRWYAVFERYLAVLNDKVRGVGGSPSDIDPSTTGEPSEPDDKHDKEMRCCRLLWWALALLAFFIVVAIILLILLLVCLS